MFKARENQAPAPGPDLAFSALVGAADQARDRKNFTDAADLYAQALAHQPHQAGYWTQLGHCRKETADWLRAEIAYRSALAAGDQEAAPHLLFVLDRAGRPSARAWIAQIAAAHPADHLSAPPTSADVTDAIELLCNRGDPPLEEIRDLLVQHPTRRSLLAHLMSGQEFRRYHRDLLRLIAETGWSG